MLNLDGAVWKKSTRSGSGNQCVEAATNLVDVVGVRDSRDVKGPAFGFAPAAFRAFLAGVKAGKYDL